MCVGRRGGLDIFPVDSSTPMEGRKCFRNGVPEGVTSTILQTVIALISSDEYPCMPAPYTAYFPSGVVWFAREANPEVVGYGVDMAFFSSKNNV